jgi:hypothetical protein
MGTPNLVGHLNKFKNMNFNITLGWWLLPTIITILCLLPWGKKKERYQSSNHIAAGIGVAIDGFAALFKALIRLAIMLITWLIYFAVLYFTK